jgi:hypothetical protein
LMAGLEIGDVSGVTYPTDTPEELPMSMVLMANATAASFNPDQLQRFVQDARTIGEQGRDKRQATNVFRYGAKLICEGRATGRLLALSMLAEQEGTPVGREMSRFTERAVSVFTLFDSSKDLEPDHAAGLTGVAPTTLNRRALQGMAAVEAAPELRHSGAQRIVAVMKQQAELPLV